MPALADAYKKRYSSTVQNGWGGNYGIYNGKYQSEQSAIGDDLTADIAKSRVRAGANAKLTDLSSRASNARSAFAAGKASNQKKLFRAKRDGAFASVGKLDKANVDREAAAATEVAELESLKTQYSPENATKIPAFKPQAMIRLW